MGNLTTPLAPRPTVYNGIEMRSRLEAWHAMVWDTKGLAWEYEPHCFASDKGQYLPDFRLLTGSVPSVHAYVETKGVIEDPMPFMERMEIIWASEPFVQLMLIEGHYERVWYTTCFPIADRLCHWVEEHRVRALEDMRRLAGSPLEDWQALVQVMAERELITRTIEAS